MGPLPNLRHERFVRALVRMEMSSLTYLPEGWRGKGYGHVWKAYKEAFPHVTKYTSLKTSSARLHRKPFIQKRKQELMKRLLTRMDITEEKILSQYQEAYDLAKDQGKTADMVSASTAQAKLVGLLRDRIETGAPGDFDNMENVSEVLEAVEKQVGSEAALALAQALGITSESKESAAPEPDTADLEELEPPSGAVN